MKQIIHDNKIYTAKENDFFGYWEEADEVKEATPTPTWKGAKIDLQNWYKFVTFCLASQKKNKAEAMVLFFYDENKEDWHLWAPPQETQGMTVNVTEGQDYDEQRTQLPPLMFGSGHHHCTSSAFQSGTDHEDEIDKEGIHVTLGNLDKQILDIHCRIIVRGVSYDVPASDVIETPKWVKEILFPDIREEAANRFLGQRFAVEYPSVWLDNVEKKTWGGISQKKTSVNNGSAYDYDDGYFNYGRHVTSPSIAPTWVKPLEPNILSQMTISQIMAEIPKERGVYLGIELLIDTIFEDIQCYFHEDIIDILENDLVSVDKDELLDRMQQRDHIEKMFQDITTDNDTIVMIIKQMEETGTVL